MGSKTMRRRRATTAPLVLLLLVLLLVAPAGVSGNRDRPSLELMEESDSAVTFESAAVAACGVDDLIPPHGEDISDMWDNETLVSPPFDCTCRTLKASYHCPSLGTGGYPQWQPRQVSRGVCKAKTRDALERDPLPAGFKVLFYGNSHLRQVVEAVVCSYSSAIRTRKLNVAGGEPGNQAEAVGADRQCRSCLWSRRKVARMLVKSGCVSEEEIDDACSCDTNESTFELNNGAVVHYHFAHKEEDKSIEDALRVHGTELSDYGAVFANPGNEPRMEVSETLRAAERLKEAGVPFFWMSAYDGEGDIGAWLPEEQESFWENGARLLQVHRMVESLKYLTKGAVEGERHNPHFCLPGPPNEIGVLLLNIAWALHDETKR